jgi:capsular polysaccharide biosynthesis protein
MSAVEIRDIAAHYETGTAPRIGFHCLAPAARSVPPAPLFVLGPANAVVQRELFGQMETGAVGCYAIDDAVVAPTGIAMAGGVAFASASFIHPAHHVATVVARLRREDLPVRRVRDPVAVIYGPGHETYGHWLLDFLPRLWVLAACGHDLASLRFVIPPDLAPFARALLGLVGLVESQLVIYRYWREVLRADRLLMPTGLRLHNRMSPLFRQATDFWTARLGGRCAGGGDPAAKIFLSRSGAPGQRVLTNRALIETIARDHGYGIVFPESLALPAQAALFAGARTIVGEYGSALHGSVFAASGSVTCALRGNLRHPSFMQSGVASALGQSVGYVLGATEGDIAQRFAIDPGDFRLGLEFLDLAHEA